MGLINWPGKARRILTITAGTKFRIGFSLALLAGIAISVTILLANVSLVSRNAAWIAIGTGLVGFFGLFVGRAPGSKGKETTADEAPSDRVAHPMIFLRSTRYWGTIIILSGVM